MKIIKSVDDAKESGLDTSCYQYIEGCWWLSASDAAALVSCVNGHQIDTKYLNNPIKQGRLHPRRLHNRCNLYQFDELIKIDIRPAGRPRLTEDKLTDTARRQREFKARRRAQQEQKSLV